MLLFFCIFFKTRQFGHELDKRSHSWRTMEFIFKHIISVGLQHPFYFLSFWLKYISIDCKTMRNCIVVGRKLCSKSKHWDPLVCIVIAQDFTHLSNSLVILIHSFLRLWSWLSLFEFWYVMEVSWISAICLKLIQCKINSDDHWNITSSKYVVQKCIFGYHFISNHVKSSNDWLCTINFIVPYLFCRNIIKRQADNSNFFMLAFFVPNKEHDAQICVFVSSAKISHRHSEWIPLGIIFLS